MLLSELKEIKFDLFDYPESKEKADLAAKIAGAGGFGLHSSELADLDDSDFALVITEGKEKLRKYPLCDTKTASVSKIFLQAAKAELPYTLYKMAEKNINSFLTSGKVQGNTISTKELYSQEKEREVKLALAQRESLSDDDYALVINNSGVKARFYPINDEHNCKIASEYFSKNLNAIPVHLRHKFASAIVLKCKTGGFDQSIITPDIKSYCSNRVNPNLDLEISLRKTKIANAKVCEALDALLELSKKENLIKVANLLYKLDTEFGLDKFYDKSFSDAYRAVFDGSALTKTANVSIVGEYEAKPPNLASLPYEGRMAELFSPEDFAAIKQDPAAFEALPEPYKQAILQQIPQ